MANSMAVVFGPQPAGIGNKHVYAINMTIDTYESGGIKVPLPASITAPIVFIQATGGYVGEWDETNGKVKLYSSGSEVSSVSPAVSITVLFIGQ